MFSLLRWTFWLAAIFALVYFAATVPLGSRTFVEHVRAIAATPAAQDLARGTEQKAAELSGKVQRQIGAAPRVEAHDGERLTPSDRDDLDHLVREKTRH